MLRYFDAAAVTAELVLSAFATYLSLPSSFFDPFHDKKDHQLEVKMYPAIAQSALGERSLGFRLPVHTDLSSLTLLIQDRMGGLIVQERETQEWLPVQVIDNAILVNTGQFISDWTGAVLPSTKVGWLKFRVCSFAAYVPVCDMHRDPLPILRPSRNFYLCCSVALVFYPSMQWLHRLKQALHSPQGFQQSSSPFPMRRLPSTLDNCTAP